MVAETFGSVGWAFLNCEEQLPLVVRFVGSTARIVADVRDAMWIVCEASSQFALRSSAPIRVVDPTNPPNQGNQFRFFGTLIRRNPSFSAPIRVRSRLSRIP
jgi:hypothetical protein